MNTLDTVDACEIISDYCAKAYSCLDEIDNEELPFVAAILGFDIKNTLESSTLCESSDYYEIEMLSKGDEYENIAITALNIYASRNGKKLVSRSMIDSDGEFTIFD